MTSADAIKELLTTSPKMKTLTRCDVIDESGGCGAKFVVVVVSDETFAGLGKLERTRLVNSILEEPRKSVHAWTFYLWTQEEYDRLAPKLLPKHE